MQTFATLAQIFPLPPNPVPPPTVDQQVLLQQQYDQTAARLAAMQAQQQYGSAAYGYGYNASTGTCAPGFARLGGVCRQTPVFADDEFYGEGQTTAETAELVVQRITPIAYGSLILIALLFFWRNRALARAQSKPVAGRTTVRGTVLGDPAKGPVVRCEIRQQGREWQHKGGWSHQWKELNRTYFATPFELRTETGDVVRVEPDAQPLLVSGLPDTVRHEHTLRTRIARVQPGDQVTVIGAQIPTSDPRSASFGYRGSAESSVLRAPSGGRVLVSTEPLEERFNARVTLHKKWAVAFALLLLGTNALFYMGYWARTFAGRELQTTITSMRTYVTRSKNSTTTHYELTGTAIEEGQPLVITETVNRAAYYQIRQGDQVPFFVVGGGSWFTVAGRAPTVHVAGVIFSALLGLGVAIGYLAHGLSSRPWYARSRWNEGAGGRL